ncbi:hypothetical protein H1D32_05755 [Anaerobacillus sp. CMMVII]|uniref:hypothetical protein n=1 Tax=Anaerobacillus sp. CMMVII TaxID=2755588 RepID=UPI0021B7A088|nr:hypothetical protein [Anaerobacillus sp. CMMVII]MCT8137292.1 hypothetical protein [Anaerobacillus sp. CMMVII]
MMISGTLHPISIDFGEITTTLFDKEKATIIIGTKDLIEYTYELLDIAIAQELEKILLLEKKNFFRFYTAKIHQIQSKFLLMTFNKRWKKSILPNGLKKRGTELSIVKNF